MITRIARQRLPLVRYARLFATKNSGSEKEAKIEKEPQKTPESTPQGQFTKKFNLMVDKLVGSMSKEKQAVNLAEVVPPPKFYAHICS